MKIVNYPLNKGQWVTTKTAKKAIVWHATEGRTIHTPYKGQPGRATTSIDSWNESPERVGAPYLIDRNGIVYKTFPDEEWIYHLAIPDTNGAFDKVSIAIEFANEGGLKKVDDKYYAFGRTDPNSEYIGPVIDKNWHGCEYVADLSEEQIKVGIQLTLDLCKKYSIKPKFYRADGYNAHAWREATIVRHSTVNANKSDFYLPGWAWDMISKAGIPFTADL